MSEPRQGWRYFKCDDCEHMWKEKSRDCHSPSGDNCPRCGDWAFPFNVEPDATIPVDKWGNLIP